MSDKPSFEREVRDTVVKSGLTGVAATVAAVTIFSPAALGGMIGTSLASGFGVDANVTPAESPYTNLPPFREPLSHDDLSEIRSQLAQTAASMAFAREATEARIEHVRSIALADGAVTFSPLPSAPVQQAVAQAAPAAPELRLSLSEPVAAAPVAASVSAEEPAPAEAAPVVRISYSGNGGGADYVVPQRDPHLELAELFMAFDPR